MAEPTLNANLAEAYTRRTITLFRFDAGIRKNIRRMLGDLEGRLTRDIERIDPTGSERLSVRQARTLALQKQVKKSIAAGINVMKKSATSDLRSLAQIEARNTRQTINGMIGVDALTVAVGAERLNKLASNVMIEGTPAAEHWSRIGGNTERRFMDSVRAGVLRGEGAAEIARNARRDGLPATRREAEALVRTSVLAVANQANQATYEANDDVLRGQQAVVTFDLRTTELCISRSDAAWDFEGNPLPESPRQEPYPGPPPWHWGCRTILIPVVKSLRQIAAVDPSISAEIPKTTRATMDGQIAEGTTFDAWLKTQPFEHAVELLGQSKAELWQAGSISLTELSDQSGRELSVQELRDIAQARSGNGPGPVPPPLPVDEVVEPPPQPPAPPAVEQAEEVQAAAAQPEIIPYDKLTTADWEQGAAKFNELLELANTSKSDLPMTAIGEAVQKMTNVVHPEVLRRAAPDYLVLASKELMDSLNTDLNLNFAGLYSHPWSQTAAKLGLRYQTGERVATQGATGIYASDYDPRSPRHEINFVMLHEFGHAADAEFARMGWGTQPDEQWQKQTTGAGLSAQAHYDRGDVVNEWYKERQRVKSNGFTDVDIDAGGNIDTLAMRAYSLQDDKEWVADAWAAYFEPALAPHYQQHFPKTYQYIDKMVRGHYLEDQAPPPASVR